RRSNDYGGLIALTQASNMIINPISNFIDVKNNMVASKEILNKCDKKLDKLTFNKTFSESLDLLDDDIKNIQMKDLSIKFDDKTILENINMEIENGKKYIIIGRSGSGKTSILNAILKRIKVDDNHIFINDMDINSI